MIFWDYKIKKIITVFSLLFLGHFCFGLTKKGLDYNFKVSPANKNAYYLYKQIIKSYPPSKSFTERYIIKDGQFYYLPDLLFSHLENYSYFENLYIPETDSADWVDEIIFATEEERIASEISGMENTDEEFQYENFDSEEIRKEIEESMENESREEYFLSKDSSVSRMSLDKEIFMVQKKSDSFLMTHVNEYQIERILYDLKYRTVRRELWNTDATINNQNIIYEYEEDEIYPSRKIIEKLDVNPAQKEIISYNSENFVTDSKTYVLVSEKDKNNVESIRQELISSSEWKYDSKNRVIKTIQHQNFYSTTEYKKQTDVFEKKYIYVYHDSESEEENEESIPADTEYYEDNILRMKLTYKTKQDFIKQYYFDDEYNVTSHYENNKLVKEIYRIGNTIIRTKNYDN